MKKRKVIASLLVAALTLGSLAGCAKPTPPKTTESSMGNSENKADNTQKDNEPVEISIALWDIGDSIANAENDKLYKTISEKTGVKIKPVNVTWDDADQKIQLWATNGQLPDVFAGGFVTSSFFHKWIEQGVIQPLPEDLSPYPNLQNYLKMDRAVAAMQNGRYYMIPRRTYGDITYSSQDRSLLYRWDLAKAAGVTKEPETYDEFRDMIKKIIAADPEKKNIGGLTQVTAHLLHGLILPYGNIIEKKWVVEDGKFKPGYFAGDMKAAMQLARDMYEEGTIEKDIALAKFDTSKEKFLQGQSAAILVAGGGPSWLYKEIGKDYEKLYGRKFSDDIKVAPIFPCADGKKHYFIDTEAWSESYISSKVDEKKMAAICRLYDFLSSEEGKYLSFCGFEGEDYDIKDGKVVLKEGISLKDKYPYIKGASYICMWDPSSWDMSFPSDTPDEYRQWNVERHKQAVEEGSLPKYYDNVLFLSTPLKDSFVINSKDDLYQVMLGSEPVDKMVDDIMAGYETKGLSKMIDEVNKKAEEVGIKQ